jgi:GNAT superfamily N-acetyltransferase
MDELAVRRAALEEIIALRHAELRPGLPRADAEFEGDHEPAARHFGAFLPGGTCVGCASFVPRPWHGESAYQLRGMATRADLVRRGIGSRLLAVAEQELGADGVELLWCNARVEAVPFYLRLGWRIASGRFDIPGVGPHHAMVSRRQSSSPER